MYQVQSGSNYDGMVENKLPAYYLFNISIMLTNLVRKTAFDSSTAHDISSHYFSLVFNTVKGPEVDHKASGPKV